MKNKRATIIATASNLILALSLLFVLSIARQIKPQLAMGHSTFVQPDGDCQATAYSTSNCVEGD